MAKTNPGNFFEDFEVGSQLVHAVPRTITEGEAAFLRSQNDSLAGDICQSCHTQMAEIAGSSEEEALRTATDNACAFLASGMTDSIACSKTAPDSVTCSAE